MHINTSGTIMYDEEVKIMGVYKAEEEGDSESTETEEGEINHEDDDERFEEVGTDEEGEGYHMETEEGEEE
jgi:hypothetical protein